VAVVMEALGKDPRLDVADFMFKQGWLDVPHDHWLPKEPRRTSCKRPAIWAGWMPSKTAAALAAQQADPLSISDFLEQQGWLSVEQVAWLQNEAAEQAAPATELKTEPIVTEAGTGHLPMPTDVEFIPKLDADGAFAQLNDYLRLGQQYGGADTHIGVGAPLFTAKQTQRLLMSFLDESQTKRLKEIGDLDFCYDAPGLGRFRTSVVRQRVGVDGVFRVINTTVRTMDELGLPESLKKLTSYHNGLILVTGSVSSGKSTTLAASLRGVVAQLLLKKADGIGRVAVNDILIANTAVSAIIREGRTEKLLDVLASGKSEGMQAMDDVIMKNLQKGVVAPVEAYMKAIDKTRFEKLRPDRPQH
jgi:hypothetical protein